MTAAAPDEGSSHVETHRLDTIAPRLRRKFQEAAHAKQRAALVEALEELSVQFDEHDLKLSALAKERLTAQAASSFSKARAADALKHALGSDESDRLEALYEAIQSANDQDAAIRRIEGILDGPT
jgi:hypothetical protein